MNTTNKNIKPVWEINIRQEKEKEYIEKKIILTKLMIQDLLRKNEYNK